MTKNDLNFSQNRYAFSPLLNLSLWQVASKSGIIERHKAIINRQLTQAILFCKILKSFFCQNNVYFAILSYNIFQNQLPPGDLIHFILVFVNIPHCQAFRKQ